MPRDLPLGNGSLLVAFDKHYQIRDLYWPHVGQENHALEHAFRLGVWQPLSVSPLTWIHAVYVATVQVYLDSLVRLKNGQNR